MKNQYSYPQRVTIKLVKALGQDSIGAGGQISSEAPPFFGTLKTETTHATHQ
jgi:hypothetical protein